MSVSATVLPASVLLWRRIIRVIAAAVCALWVLYQAGFAVTLDLEGSSADIASIRSQGATYISVRELAKALGFSWRWDMINRELECEVAAGRVRIKEKALVAERDDAFVQLALPPIYDRGDLYLEIAQAAELFSLENLGTLTFDRRNAVLRFLPADAVKENAASKTAPAPAAPEIQDAEDQRIRTVVIDPGHGGKDPGAIGPGGIKEKDVVLPVALALRDELVKRTDLTVYLTRSADVFIQLRERTDFANEKNADLFVSIHANSIGGSRKKREQVKGYKVYFLSEAKNEEDKRVAMMENSVVEFERKKNGGDFVQNILLNMAASEYLLESQDLSIMIAETFGASLKKISKIHTGVGQGPFWVLFGASMPSVLIETGFISNSKEEKLLADTSVQKQLAKAVCEAIIAFKKRYEAEL